MSFKNYISSSITFLTSSKVGTFPNNLTVPLIIRAGGSIIPAFTIEGISPMISKSSSLPSSVNTPSTMGAILLPPQQILSKILISIKYNLLRFLKLSFTQLKASLFHPLKELFQKPLQLHRLLNQEFSLHHMKRYL